MTSPADAIAQPGGLLGLVVVEADQHPELGQHFFSGIDPAQRARHGPGGLGDDVGIAGVGLGRPRVQVSNPAHRQAGQVGDLAAHVAGHSDRQRTDRGRLIDDHQDLAVGPQVGEQLAQPLRVLR